MNTENLNSNGGSQAIRIPKGCRFDDSELLVQKVREVDALFPKEDMWRGLLASLDLFTDDYLSEPICPLPLDVREPIE